MSGIVLGAGAAKLTIGNWFWTEKQLLSWQAELVPVAYYAACPGGLSARQRRRLGAGPAAAARRGDQFGQRLSPPVFESWDRLSLRLLWLLLIVQLIPVL